MKNGKNILKKKVFVLLKKNEVLEEAVKDFKTEWNKQGMDDWIFTEDSLYLGKTLLIVVFSRDWYIGDRQNVCSMVYVFEEGANKKVYNFQIYYEEYFQTHPLKLYSDNFIRKILSAKMAYGQLLIKAETDQKTEKELTAIY